MKKRVRKRERKDVENTEKDVYIFSYIHMV
jgi:hypothetical protein